MVWCARLFDTEIKSIIKLLSTIVSDDMENQPSASAIWSKYQAKQVVSPGIQAGQNTRLSQPECSQA